MHPENFPRLTSGNHRITSPSTWDYNCIAWALGEDDVWYSSQAGYYWPQRGVPRNTQDAAVVAQLYIRLHGYEDCNGDTSHNEGFEKVAIYTGSDGTWTHVALQRLEKWTSKLGPHEDIEHETAEVLLGGECHAIAFVLRRPRRD